MGVKRKKDVELYGLDPDFERDMVVSLCRKPKLYNRIGNYIEPSALTDDVALRLMQTAQVIANETGSGPSSDVIVIQRLNRMREEGSVSQEEINACLDFFDEFDDNEEQPNLEQIANEIIPILKRRKQREALDNALDGFGKRKDISYAVETLQRVDRLGATEETKGLDISSAGAFDLISQLQSVVRLGFDVPEIETLMEGGLWRSGLGVVVAGPGGGKSIFLSHIAACAIRNPDLLTVFITLELPKPLILARLFANLFDIPTNNILTDSLDKAKAKAATMKMGTCVIEEFTPKVTTLEDVRDFVEKIEADLKRPVDLLVVDYADKLGARKTDDSSYREMSKVYEGLRHFAVEKNMWVWTASQPQRAKEKGRKKLTIDSLADSQEKVRVADMVLAINKKEDGTQLEFCMLKNRIGIADTTAGPLPHEFDMGRIAPIIVPVAAADDETV